MERAEVAKATSQVGEVEMELSILREGQEQVWNFHKHINSSFKCNTLEESHIIFKTCVFIFAFIFYSM